MLYLYLATLRRASFVLQAHLVLFCKCIFQILWEHGRPWLPGEYLHNFICQFGHYLHHLRRQYACRARPLTRVKNVGKLYTGWNCPVMTWLGYAWQGNNHFKFGLQLESGYSDTLKRDGVCSMKSIPLKCKFPLSGWICIENGILFPRKSSSWTRSP